MVAVNIPWAMSAEAGGTAGGGRPGKAAAKPGYHHGNLREALIAAALQLAREGGPDAIVVREASRRVGVSHNAAYRHFPDRESLLWAVGERCMAELAALMERLTDEASPSREGLPAARARLTATGRAYVGFATTEPGLFRTGFAAARSRALAAAAAGEPMAPGEASAHGAGDAQDALGPLGLLTRALDDLDRAGGIAAGAREGAEFVAWSGVHGFSQLCLEGPLGELPPAEREAALGQLTRSIELGLAAPR